MKPVSNKISIVGLSIRSRITYIDLKNELCSKNGGFVNDITFNNPFSRLKESVLLPKHYNSLACLKRSKIK